MKDKLDHSRGWLLKAESDLLAAEKLVTVGGPYDMACFHSQQAAEKYLKALLAFADQPIPRTHNLEDLDRLCEQAVSNWHIAGVDLTRLTPYAVELRYDFEFWPDQATAEEALQDAKAVRAAVLSILPLQPFS